MGMPPEVSAAQIATVVVTQLSTAAAVVAIEVAVTGGAGLIVPIASLFASGTGAFYALGLRQDRWPQRPAIQRTAWASAAVFWGASTAAYVAAYVAMPSAFDFGWRALAGLAPVVALLPGLSALVLTMCAGDAAATALRSYDEMREEVADDEQIDLYERFSDRTRARYGNRHGNRNRAKIPGR